jgi:hypothetical protein
LKGREKLSNLVEICSYASIKTPATQDDLSQHLREEVKMLATAAFSPDGQDRTARAGYLREE